MLKFPLSKQSSQFFPKSSTILFKKAISLLKALILKKYSIQLKRSIILLKGPYSIYSKVCNFVQKHNMHTDAGLL